MAAATTTTLKCPVCMELPFNAMVNTGCGHTICEFCWGTLENEGRQRKMCPECRTTAEWKPNFMVRSCLEEPLFAEAMKQLKQRWFDQSEEGQIQHLVSEYNLEYKDMDKKFGTPRILFALQLVSKYSPSTRWFDIAPNWYNMWLDKFHENPTLAYDPCNQMSCYFPPSRVLHVHRTEGDHKTAFMFSIPDAV